MKDKIIIDDVLYRIEFLYDSKEIIVKCGMTEDDFRSAFLDDEDMLESLNSQENLTMILQDQCYRILHVEKTGNLLEIIKVFNV
ncbi:hypothetical protein [Tissierella sp. Yu-01]|jgi:hypothetical protein|uniref:hypothetical protein n=1 Tax=Tissierella sp. Yu-01 TaxID=3035694 RepID=UPI00240D6941|nr:hypothetical protein [Tissierella sp. Yu-01]WFA09588.1 hypothetical protein P3962_03270 [Tissierella sp. Yu-01]